MSGIPGLMASGKYETAPEFDRVFSFIICSLGAAAEHPNRNKEERIKVVENQVILFMIFSGE